MNEQNSKVCEQLRQDMHFLTSSEDMARLQVHVIQCASCRAEWQSLQTLLRHLREVEVEPMRETFVDSAFDRVREYQTRQASTPIKALIGMAASVLLVGALFLYNQPDISSPNEATYDLLATMPGQVDSTLELRIAFNSPGKLENVGIELMLPQGIGLAGEQQRAMSWRTDLYEGKNELTLPLKRIAVHVAPATGEFVTARLTHGSKVKEFKVRLLSSEQV